MCVHTVTSPHSYKADEGPDTMGGTEQHLINVFFLTPIPQGGVT